MPRAPHRHDDGDHHGQQAAAARDGTANVEDVRRVGIEEEAPLEQLPRVIDRGPNEVEPRRAKAYLIAQDGSYPLRCTPHTGDHDAEDGINLPEQHAMNLHRLASGFPCADSSFKCSAKNMPAWREGQYRSKTIIGSTLMKKASFQTGEKPIETPQARARCGVFQKFFDV